MTLSDAPPVAALPPEAGVEALASLLRGRRVVVLTGAGCSTESGIPDYRGPETRHKVRNPIQHREFLQRPEVRARYWARSLLGWPRFTSARPNDAHFALAALERSGVTPGLITQNVDGLHHAAGSERVLELHGALSRVRCLACQAQEPRASVQARMLGLNPDFAHTVVELRPDGDAELPPEAVADFRVPACTRCGGTLKPDVVFFGDNVAAPLVQDAFALLEEGDALLVVGSSLTVYSGFRFVTRAAERHVPIGILNLGESRGDSLADVRVEARAGDVLPRLVESLTRA
ncbi:NAD-dependent protein deacetylase [Corallococcus sp. ZKHCc1 1396]|uniref:NAD-dependent protein deacetylase n=1 Tax=Corallococcus soli TaxID=2710757 RepID=A0ABR9PTG3_9BACT|nr:MULTISPECIES: NAD-dependent protein deacetylase [Corallococcus]MBE4751220.1 NAD-dependent protein deacetylase [Corallococcus soli]MCY1033062.1 NAD-dependent protein deacetylase [Corallococcus sp. BB11-1]